VTARGGDGDLVREPRVEVLVFDGCPNVNEAIRRVHVALGGDHGASAVRIVRVESAADAARLAFLGSPTVRVDGVDVEPGADRRTDFGLQCRVYSVGGRMDGAPAIEWISAALRGDRPEVDGSAAPLQPGCCAKP
jgi:hypothetical protein